MTEGPGGDEGTDQSPDEAFALLGDETRIRILQALGEAGGPVRFGELRERVGSPDSGGFSYHLKRLDGRFLRKTDEGYVLRQPGRRVFEAVLSGAVAEDPVLAPTRVGLPCPYCGSDVEVSYAEERMLVRCTECVGSFGTRTTTGMESMPTLPRGTVMLAPLSGSLHYAGLRDRTPEEALDAVLAWSFGEKAAIRTGICPRCSGHLDHALRACPDHDAGDGICGTCDARFGVTDESTCGTCHYRRVGAVMNYLVADRAVRSFFETRGIDVVAPDWTDLDVLHDYDEAVLGTDPFEARVTFSVGGDRLSVTVDGALNVVSAVERDATDSA